MLVSRTIKESELVKCGDNIGLEVVNYIGKRLVIPTHEIKSDDVFELVDKIKEGHDKLVDLLVGTGHNPQDINVNVFVVDHRDGIVRTTTDDKLAITVGMYYLHKSSIEDVEIGF